MSENLNVIFDVSGSFSEYGKISILKMLKFSITRTAKNFGAATNFFFWNEEIKQFEGKKDFEPRGTASVSALKKFFFELAETSKILLVTDNFKNLEDVSEIKKVLKDKNLHLILVTVGAGAEISKNYNISTIGGIFSPADIVSATEILIFCDKGGAT